MPHFWLLLFADGHRLGRFTDPPLRFVSEAPRLVGQGFTMLIILFASIGFLISSYFTAISYRWIDPGAGWIPTFCRMGEKTCASIVFTPRARVLGLPNSLLGQLFYLVLITGTLGNFLYRAPLYFFFIVASAGTVLLGAFLTYSLLFLTRVPCKLCFISHGLNLAIFITLLLD